LHLQAKRCQMRSLTLLVFQWQSANTDYHLTLLSPSMICSMEYCITKLPVCKPSDLILCRRLTECSCSLLRRLEIEGRRALETTTRIIRCSPHGSCGVESPRQRFRAEGLCLLSYLLRLCACIGSHHCHAERVVLKCRASTRVWILAMIRSKSPEIAKCINYARRISLSTHINHFP
jgi:putative component of membrane protein insertase Oxa1/YidC/SpoIIIJ protein YidD